VFWSPFEDGSGTVSSPVPLICKPGYEMVPSSYEEKEAKGYNRFRCMQSNLISLMRHAPLFLQSSHQSGVHFSACHPVS
jgi:hypothetical protein